MKTSVKKAILKIILIFVVIGLDLLTKHLFYNNKDLVIIPYLIGVRQIDYLNTGGAWSMLSNHLWLLVLITFIFLIIVAIYDVKSKNNNLVYDIAFSFIVGGAVGNLIDRIFLGGVRDFIYFIFVPNFPTFNVADSFLLIGTILFAIYAIFIYKPQEKDKNESTNKNI